mgnify:CR=1 FL=1
MELDRNLNLLNEYPEIYEEMKLVENYIRENIKSRNKTLESIVETLILSGGKRLRPLFVINSAKFGKYKREKAIPIAGALEILHTATLVHDDIIDNAKTRRGIVTVSEKYGTDMAIYTGDFLFTKAVIMMSGKVPEDKMETIAKALKTICEGEVDQFLDRFKINTSIISYLKRIFRKTALLFTAACTLGSNSADCKANDIKKLGRFGFYYGMAFQIRDDINDFVLTEKDTGKPIGNDISRGIITLPAIYAMVKSRAVQETVLSFKGRENRINKEEIDKAIDMVIELGGVNDAEKLLAKYIDRGLELLDTFPDSTYKNLFRDLITGLA